ncbi:hypothetical protein AgCh_013807 [Apium graveolens]
MFQGDIRIQDLNVEDPNMYGEDHYKFQALRDIYDDKLKRSKSSSQSTSEIPIASSVAATEASSSTFMHDLYPPDLYPHTETWIAHNDCFLTLKKDGEASSIQIHARGALASAGGGGPPGGDSVLGRCRVYPEILSTEEPVNVDGSLFGLYVRINGVNSRYAIPPGLIDIMPCGSPKGKEIAIERMVVKLHV